MKNKVTHSRLSSVFSPPSSETHYRTRDSDVLDAICAEHYGQQSGAVEAVLAANPGLAGMGAVLPAGIIITLPTLPKPAQHIQPVRLWD